MASPTSSVFSSSDLQTGANPDSFSEEHHQHIKDDSSDSLGKNFTLRSVIVGLLISIPVCLSNVYFGLQTGFYGSMSNASTTIGFAIITLTRRPRSTPFSAKENVLIQTVAGAAGCMPAAGGLLAAIPALEFLTVSDDGGPVKLTYLKTVFWSMGVGFIGLIFTMFLRERLVVRTKLPYPGPLATASLIKTLHLKRPADHPSRFTPNEESHLEAALLVPSSTEGNSGLSLGKAYGAQVKAMAGAAIGSGLFTLMRYFVPALKHIPILGMGARDNWLWYLDLSPGFIGTGIITGPIVPYHMMCGAIVGWGILSPIAHSKGWAEGDVGDWEKGARGWISWIGLAALFGDCAVKLIWPLIVAIRKYLSRNPSQLGYARIATTNDNSNDDSHLDGFQSSPNAAAEVKTSPPSIISSKSLTLGLITASILCVISTNVAFRFMPAHIVLIAIAVSLPLSVMGIQAVGETDFNPVAGIGKVSQLLFAVIVPRSHPNSLLINLVAGSIAEAGATQSGDIVSDLRLGHLVGADPQAQLYGQLIGCFAGAFMSGAFYKLYTSAYAVPGTLFQVPVAYMALMAARLVTGKGLPSHVFEFGLSFGIFFFLAAVVKIRYAKERWHHFIPSGTAFAVGIITSPSFSMARMIGGLAYWYSSSYRGYSREFMILLASGLVLGEGLFSLITLALQAFTRP